MIIIEIAQLCLMFIIGLLCSYNDIKTGMVPNRVLFFGILIGTMLHLISVLIGLIPYYPQWMKCMLLADVLSILMYAGKIWAAGDTKLFMVMFFLFPPVLLDYGSLSYGIIPFFFVFLPALVWIIIDTIWNFIRKEPFKRPANNYFVQLINMIIVMIESTVLHELLAVLFPQFVVENTLVASTLVLVYAFFCSSKMFMKKWEVCIFHIVILILLTLITGIGIPIPDWRSLLLIATTVIFQRIAGIFNYRLIKTAAIQKGMIIAGDEILRFQASRVQGLPHNPSEELSARITDVEADAVKRWGHSSKGKDSIWIVRKIPFAAMIFIGYVIWTVIRFAR